MPRHSQDRTRRDLLLYLGIAVGVGMVFQQRSTDHDLRQNPAPGKLIPVDEANMHLFAQGEGAPTVVFECGLGSNYLDWTNIQPQVAKYTRTVAYDRSGLGYSDFVGGALAPAGVARRLHTLLHKAGEKPPFLLVGHSLGGLFVRAFAQAYPDEVAGMVLIDSSHEQQGHRLPPEILAESTKDRLLRQIRPLLARVGWLRLTRQINTHMLPGHLNAQQQNIERLTRNRTDWWQGINTERAQADPDTAQHVPPAPLGDLPLCVLSHDTRRNPDSELDRVWEQMQAELAALSTNGEHVIVAQAGHGIHHHAPELVIEAIVSMVKQLEVT